MSAPKPGRFANAAGLVVFVVFTVIALAVIAVVLATSLG